MGIELAPLCDFAEQVRRELGFPGDSVGVQFISDGAMARLNRQFRGKRGPTDVLSFPIHDKKQRGRKSRAISRRAHVGDIAISPETAQRNASRDCRPLDEELRVLILHGMIHLAGYDHETDNGAMVKFENSLRRRFGLDRR
ncbi:MAG: rRNA maturation RNase YbeY [Chthoniobacterales bacterium]